MRAYVSYQQDNRATKLSMNKFSSNNQVSEMTQSTPFMSKFGFSIRMSESLREKVRVSGELDATVLVGPMALVDRNFRAEMKWAQDCSEE